MLEAMTTHRSVKPYFEPASMSVAQFPGSMYPTDTSRPGPAIRSIRTQSGVLVETSTLPRTSEGQNGAVAVVGRRGNLNKASSGLL